jgi:hypothetical protein
MGFICFFWLVQVRVPENKSSSFPPKTCVNYRNCCTGKAAPKDGIPLFMGASFQGFRPMEKRFPMKRMVLCNL